MSNKVAVVAILLAACLTSTAQTTAGLNAPDLFQKGMNALTGSSATRSGPMALDYFRRSSELGFAPAQVALGYLYETGLYTTADPREALEWYKKAARQDDPLAQWLVGRMEFSGEAGPRDLNEAASWLAKSAAQDNPFAEYLLGRVALERSDYPRAAQKFQQAAMQGLPQAQRHLAILLRNGQGVSQDKFEAYIWMLVSSDAGLNANSEDLHALEAELSSSQIEQAKSKAGVLEGNTRRSAVAHGCTGWPSEFNDIPASPPPDLQRFCR